MTKAVKILGETWTISTSTEREDEHLTESDAYTDWTTRQIVVADIKPDKMSVKDLDAYKRKVLRHEIIHAFLLESGLNENSTSADAWAGNEEMIDFFAYQGLKIVTAWKEAGCYG